MPSSRAATDEHLSTGETQQSKLLLSLFEGIDQDQRISVLHMGPALPETVDFFSRYRCKIQFVDLFAELPVVCADEEDMPLEEQFRALLDLPQGTGFDLCLFWDLFNYLEGDAITALLQVLHPCLHTDSRGHGFAVHNARAPRKEQTYAIAGPDTLKIRPRNTELPDYRPRTQGQLDRLLSCFSFERSVLLPDSQLEWVLSVRAGRPRSGLSQGPINL